MINPNSKPTSSYITKLVIILDSILYSRPHSISRLSNTFLSFVRPHPIHLARYEILNSRFFAFKSLLFLLRNLFSLSFLFLRACVTSCKPTSISSFPSDCVLLSHLVDRSSLFQEDDFYFNRIQRMLINHRLKTSLLYINSLPGSHPFDQRPVYSAKSVLPSIPSLSVFLAALLFSIADSFFLLRDAFYEPCPFRTRVILMSLVYNLSPTTIITTSRSLLISRLVSKRQAKFLFLLFEGHPWERAAIFACRNQNPRIFVFAYQHASLFPYQHSISRPLTPTTEPDILLTSGSTSHEFLSDSYSRNSTSPHLCLIGSPRHIQSPPFTLFPTCITTLLFIPDGTPLESLEFLRLSLELASRKSCLNIIIRFHPLVHLSHLKKQLNICSTPLPVNLCISSQSLQSDISSSTHAIYHGSSSVTAAALSGLSCIRYNYVDDSHLGDPFFLTSFQTPSFSCTDQLINILSSDIQSSLSYSRQFQSAQSLYSSFTPERILPYIDSCES